MQQLAYLERNSIINAKHTSYKTGINYYKVNRTINKYVELGILKDFDESKKRRTYVSEEYVEIIKKIKFYFLNIVFINYKLIVK